MAQETPPEQANRYEQMVARAWRDAAFKQRLLDDPRAALAELGIAVPKGHEVRVFENNAQLTHLVLPHRPRYLTDEQLDQVAAGERGDTSPTIADMQAHLDTWRAQASVGLADSRTILSHHK
jgi:hypothetical protein